jgi:hypothetical protein
MVFISILLCSSCSSVPVLIFFFLVVSIRCLSPSYALLSESCFPSQLMCGSQRALCRSARAAVGHPFGLARLGPNHILAVAGGSRVKFPFFSAKPKARRLFSFPRAAPVRFSLCRSRFSPMKICSPPDLFARCSPSFIRQHFPGAARAISVCRPRFVSPTKIRQRPVHFCSAALL